MKKSNSFFLLLALVINMGLTAQIVYPGGGDLKMLANQSTLLVKYDYSGMMMADESTEAAFLEKMRAELNEKNPGRGDEFVAKWHSSKKEKWEPKFEELFNKYEGKISISQTNTDAKYTLIVKTFVVFPGQLSSAGLGAIPSYISCEFLIVETANPDVVLCKSIVKHVAGSPYCTVDNPGHCIQEAYAKIAKAYSNHVKKNKK